MFATTNFLNLPALILANGGRKFLRGRARLLVRRSFAARPPARRAYSLVLVNKRASLVNGGAFAPRRHARCSGASAVFTAAVARFAAPPAAANCEPHQSSPSPASGEQQQRAE